MANDNITDFTPIPPPMPCVNFELSQPVTCTNVMTTVDKTESFAHLESIIQGRPVKLKHVTPILQKGPTCGPVALGMLFKQTPEDLVTLAQSMGFSNNGEMFSCRDMTALTKLVAERCELDVEVTHCTGELCSEGTLERLLNGAVLLVPYDSDYNFSPCLRHGHQAHWALIVGTVVLQTRSYRDTLVLARHGKSARLACWRLDCLAESNEQLTDFPPHRVSDGLTYVVPVDGVAGRNGLRSQYIIIEGL